MSAPGWAPAAGGRSELCLAARRIGSSHPLNTSNTLQREWGQEQSDLFKVTDCFLASAPGSIPGLGSCSGEGIGHLLQYSWASLALNNIAKSLQTPEFQQDFISRAKPPEEAERPRVSNRMSPQCLLYSQTPRGILATPWAHSLLSPTAWASNQQNDISHNYRLLNRRLELGAKYFSYLTPSFLTLIPD